MISQRLHAFSFLLLMLKGSFSFAVVFQAPEASVAAYERYLVQSHQESYVHWFQKSSGAREATTHEQVSEFVQKSLREGPVLSGQLLKEWETLRLAIDLNREDRELLALLAEKKKVPSELCRAFLLEPSLETDLQEQLGSEFAGSLENSLKGSRCNDFKKPLSKMLKENLEATDLVFLDGVPFTKERLPAFTMAIRSRWKVISNKTADLELVGSSEELAQALHQRHLWVEGTCKDAKLVHPDFSVLAQSKIYFSEDCVAPGLPPIRSFGGWAADHKKLLWGVGIALGVFAAYQLKDKDLVVTKPW